jgi:hypothetical protein
MSRTRRRHHELNEIVTKFRDTDAILKVGRNLSVSISSLELKDAQGHHGIRLMGHEDRGNDAFEAVARSHRVEQLFSIMISLILRPKRTKPR